MKNPFKLGQEVALTAEVLTTYFRLSLIALEISEGGVSFRLDLFSVYEGDQLKSPAKGSRAGKPSSIKSGRISLGVLLDWGIVSVEQLPALIRYARLWASWQAEGTAYTQHSQSRVFLVAGADAQLTARVTEFKHEAASCLGLTNLRLTGSWSLAARDLPFTFSQVTKGSEVAESAVRALLATCEPEKDLEPLF